MALLNLPMTEDEARKMLTVWRNGVGLPVHNEFWRMMEDARKNPTPHRVIYSAHFGTAKYVTPDRIYFGYVSSLSDCEWIVPGTLKDTSNL